MPNKMAKLSIMQENNFGHKWKKLKTNQTGQNGAITQYHT
jgi:hypothetical protein